MPQASDFFVDWGAGEKYGLRESGVHRGRGAVPGADQRDLVLPGDALADRRRPLPAGGRWRTTGPLWRSGRSRPLLAAMGRLGAGTTKKKLLAERKGLSGVRDDVPVRMDECLNGWRHHFAALAGSGSPAAGGRRPSGPCPPHTARTARGSVRAGIGAAERTPWSGAGGLPPGQLAIHAGCGGAGDAAEAQEARPPAAEERLLWHGGHPARRGAVERLRNGAAVSAMAFRGEDCPPPAAPGGAMLREARERFGPISKQALDDILAESPAEKGDAGGRASHSPDSWRRISPGTRSGGGAAARWKAARAAEGTIQVLPGYEERARGAGGADRAAGPEAETGSGTARRRRGAAGDE